MTETRQSSHRITIHTRKDGYFRVREVHIDGEYYWTYPVNQYPTTANVRAEALRTLDILGK